jgi:hypothetical protein
MLGMMARSDRTREPLLDRILAVVGPSFDEVEILGDEGVPISDFAAQRNRLIDSAERKGFDWMFMLDSDEAMWPADIARVRALMTPKARLIVLPRYEFVQDFEHYDPTEYPDPQGRVFRLGIGYRFRRPVHEGLYRPLAPLSEMRLRRGVFSADTPNFHYGRLKDAAGMELKLLNYERLAAGDPLLDSLPASVVVDEQRHFYRQSVPFPGPHPLGL